jgi:hypothetical protein
MKVREHILILVINGLFLAACSGNSDQSGRDTTIVKHSIKIGKPLPPNEWHCYNVGEDKICIPQAWGHVDQNVFLLMSDLSHVAPGSYFVVGKYDKKVRDLDAAKYLKNQYLELKKDTTQLVTGSKSVKLIYTDKESFSTEYQLSIDKVPYIVYSTVFEIGNDLYDISLKMSVVKSNPYLEAYHNIKYNFYHKNSLVFTSKDKIVNAEVLDLTKL